MSLPKYTENEKGRPYSSGQTESLRDIKKTRKFGKKRKKEGGGKTCLDLNLPCTEKVFERKGKSSETDQKNFKMGKNGGKTRHIFACQSPEAT